MNEKKLIERVKRFLSKPFNQKVLTVRFFTRRGLAKIPFLPTRFHLKIYPNEIASFNWARIMPNFIPAQGILGGVFSHYPDTNAYELSFLYSFLKEGMIFFDLGAFYGIYSVVASKKVGRQGKVVAFEPLRKKRLILMANLFVNSIKNVRVESCVLASQTNELTFYIVGDGGTMFDSLKKPVTKYHLREVKVKGITIDDYCSRNGIERIDMMKIDIEGGELEAFRGASKVLNVYRPLIICEVLDASTHPWGYNAREIVHFLKELGYEWFVFSAGGKIYPHTESLEYTGADNYLAVPKEKINLVNHWIN
jgi:FkbM family methyltransferase